MTSRRGTARNTFGLSPRELEVLSYLPLGYTNKQIALVLGTSPGTVRNQLGSIYLKMDVACRAEAVGVLLRMPEDPQSSGCDPSESDCRERHVTPGT
ncbi:MAG: helix-turn-helix transcriptional regulator [Myxococcales bacterium]|nr:helix-turn-helix transcriptional regulator [Myxococcales bacterium]